MSEDAKGFYCHFDPEIFSGSLVQPGLINPFSFLRLVGDPIVKVQGATPHSVITILERLGREYESRKPGYSLVSVYLTALFLELQRVTGPGEKVKENAATRITQLYKNALPEHIYDKQSVHAMPTCWRLRVIT